MADEIVLDLGEYGEILVEPTEAQVGGLVPVARGTKRRWPASLDKLLRAPLTGLGKMFIATLPEPDADDPYEIDEFSVEFQIGLDLEVSATQDAEVGTNVGAVAKTKAEISAKIVPNGAFTCTYTWKRKKTEG